MDADSLRRAPPPLSNLSHRPPYHHVKPYVNVTFFPMAFFEMASTTDIQIVNINNLEKIESFLNDSAYKEMLENSETYNTRLCIERRLRMPFLDPQTGVAQTNCALVCLHSVIIFNKILFISQTIE